MTNKRKGNRKPVITVEKCEQEKMLALGIANRQILKAGMAVLAAEFGFTDQQQARWVELVASAAVDGVKEFSKAVRGSVRDLEDAETAG